MLTIKRTDYYDIDWLSSTQVGNYDHPHITKALLGRTLLVLVIVIIIGQSHFHEIMIINHHKCIHMLIFHQFHYIPLRSLNWGKGLLWIIGDTSFYIIINYTYIYIYIHIIELFKIRLIGYWGDSSIGKWGDISIIMHHYTSFIQGIGGINQLVTT